MAAPGTLTHVLEVARQLAAAAEAHAAGITAAAVAAAPVEPPPDPTVAGQ